MSTPSLTCRGVPARLRVLRVLLLAATAALAASCEREPAAPTVPLAISSISINSGPLLLEKGARVRLTATVRDARGDTVTVPLVWRSRNESVLSLSPDRIFTARDTGASEISASALGVTSPALAVRVVWVGPSKVESVGWTAPTALTPGTAVTDSIRVRVTNRGGYPVANARVIFAVDSGGGTIDPLVDTTDAVGIAAAHWTAGSTPGRNVVTATVVDTADQAIPWVDANPVRFVVSSYAALRPARGDGQVALLLSTLPENPAVLLVDSAGNPRPGIPVTFTTKTGGFVETPTVATDAEGVASPGQWTLSDESGDQVLEVRVESAVLQMHATATGTAERLFALHLASAGSASCAVLGNLEARCWGREPLVGDSAIDNQFKPVAPTGGLLFRFLIGSATHLCGITQDDRAIYCWGLNAMMDTSGKVFQALVPTRLADARRWLAVAAGNAHNCALDEDQHAWCWGDNSGGQLGDGTSKPKFVPVAVSGGFRFAQVVAGGTHSCGRTAAGGVFCWGLNQNGQLGDASASTRTTPTAVAGGTSFQWIGAGISHTCGLSSTGSAYCWGSLAAIPGSQLMPRAMGGSHVFTSLSVGGAHACALTADGTAYCWGDNTWGQVGDGTTTDRPGAVQVTGTLRFREISAGWAHTCGITVAGEVACWGANQHGELGEDGVTFRADPRRLTISVRP